MHDVFWIDKKVVENKYPAVTKVFEELLESGKWEYLGKADRSGALKKV
jgi:hypothetical protein